VAELSEGYCAVSIVLTKLLRLQQVLCGFVPNENETTVEIAENRTEKMMEVIEEMNGKVIIWSRFVKSIQRICNALKKEYGDDCAVEYYGATETDDRRNAVQQFQEGKPRFFVGNPQTGGYGITLTAASNVIYYANSFDLEIRMQSEDRCHRIGQNKTVTYVDLCSPKTVDEKIIKALQEKRSISDLIMDPLDRMDLLSSII
jgi:SNF2 family DNA or RNA helicase